MTEFDRDNLLIMADAWALIAETREPAAAEAMRRCAQELREFLRNADTLPAPMASSTIPAMRWPRDLPLELAGE